MARELRSRKGKPVTIASLARTNVLTAVSETKNGDAKTTVVEKQAVKGKRKAADAESPVPKKIQKSTKKTAGKVNATEAEVEVEKTTKKSKPAADDEIDVPSDSDSDGEVEVETQALVKQVDPEEEEETPEGDVVYKTGQPVGVIPDVAQAVEKAAKATSSGDAGVIYIGRIPHGFYEHEMKQYFSQFGAINKLRLSRNKKTGASKHFAFIEFAESSTADIVAKTMNNYLLFGHILKCHVIPKEKVHAQLFKDANRRFKKVPWNKMEGKKLEKPLAEATWEKRVSKEQKKRAKQSAKLQELGYGFEAPEIKAIPAPAEPVEEVAKIQAPEGETAVVTEVITETPTETTVETKSISAPKAKGKKTRKAKA
ncbi:putative RNA-binding protein -like protein [Emericellopsis cladophorae]|uniref:RNA-binding protein -like protein n=1 Tax=Emericellopsis cladophorae TaxID=2686198 RepID=A0A9Q0BER6_9HYPO|nr:putative RNA-binding protein -like protein [Emericellopsis cladophorae]KAI6781519.1 putative RNA-binding protein -like protein [Emericellopsis cladophorae]